jgi:hypothetical protein
LNLTDHRLNIARALFGCFGQRPDLVRDNRETFAVLSGASRFDCGIEREQIRLVGDARDGFDDFADRCGLLFEFLDDSEIWLEMPATSVCSAAVLATDVSAPSLARAICAAIAPTDCIDSCAAVDDSSAPAAI